MKGIFEKNEVYYLATGVIKSFNSLRNDWEKHILFVAIVSGQMQSMERTLFLRKYQKIA